MNVELIAAFLDGSNSEQQEEARKLLEELISDPSVFQPMFEILSNRSINLEIRKFVAVEMKQIIRNHFDMLNSSPGEFFDNLLSIMSEETDLYIAENISNAIVPILYDYGEELEVMVDFINQACTSNIRNSYVIGTIFLTDFISTTKIAYVDSMHEKIIPLLHQLLSSSNIEDIQYAFRLFRSVQLKEYEPNSQVDLIYAQIFQEMINIFHQCLLNESNISGMISQCIGESIEKEIPFDSPSNFYQYLTEVASDDSIPNDYRHYPFFPIISLVESHGNELKELVQPTIPLFLSISASQFQDIDYISEDNSRTIIDLFEKLANITNGSAFFSYLTEVVNDNDDPAMSFASLCAIYGASTELLKEFEQNIETIIEYIFSKLSIESKPVIEICLIMLSDFVYYFSDAIKPHISRILDMAFDIATVDDESISKDSIELISQSYQRVEIETSVVLRHLQSLKEFYLQPSELKSSIMSAIASAIYSCREDIQPYANEFTDIIIEGLSSDDILIVISSVEALGYIMAYASNEVESIFADGFEFITKNSMESENPEEPNPVDINLRDACMNALYNIINNENDYNPGGNGVAAVYPLILVIANAGINIETNEDDLYSDENVVTPVNIIKNGFLLLKALFKHHPQEFAKSELMVMCHNFDFVNLYQKFIKFTDEEVAIVAIHSAIYYLLVCQPEEINFMEEFSNIIQENEDMDVCQAVFRAYYRLLVARYEPAIASLLQFLECATSAISRNLVCQRKNIIDEDDKYSLKPDFIEPVYSILAESFKIDTSIIPQDQLLDLLSFLITKVDDSEAIEILGLLGDFIIAGGNVREEFVQFALSKIQEIDYSSAPDAIYFIRALIKMIPGSVSEIAQSLLAFFIEQLQSEVSDKQFYWATMMNVISAVFDFAKSESLSSLISMTEIIPLVLNKLPVLDDLEEADFIYSSLIEYFSANENEIQQNLMELFRVMIQTLATKSTSFDDFNLQEGTFNGIVTLTKAILESSPQLVEQIPNVLDSDEVKINRFNIRIGNSQETEE